MNIHKRHVFYIPGYEPQGSEYYERLFQKHWARFCRLNKLEATSTTSDKHPLVKRRDLHLKTPGHTGYLRYDIFENADILKQHSDIPDWKSYLLLLKLTPKAFKSAFHPSCRAVEFAWLVGLSPWIFFYLGLSIVFALFWLCLTMLNTFGFSNPYLSVPAAGLAAFIAWKGYERVYKKNNLMRVLHVGRFFLEPDNPIQHNFQERINRFVDIIVGEIQNADSDEYLIIGHSLGAIIAARVVAGLIGKLPDNHPKISLICLASIYQIEFCAQTHINTREDIYRKIRDYPNISWGEVFSSFDPFCPRRLNPCDIRLQPEEGSMKPIFRSANFKKNLRPERFAKLQKNLLWIHMQHIQSSDLAVTFDYFKMITTDQTAIHYLSHN